MRFYLDQILANELKYRRMYLDTCIGDTCNMYRYWYRFNNYL